MTHVRQKVSVRRFDEIFGNRSFRPDGLPSDASLVSISVSSYSMLNLQCGLAVRHALRSLGPSAGYTSALYAQSGCPVPSFTVIRISCSAALLSSVLCLELGQDAVNAVMDADPLDVPRCTESLHAVLYEMRHVCAALARSRAALRRAQFCVGGPMSPSTHEASRSDWPSCFLTCNPLLMFITVGNFTRFLRRTGPPVIYLTICSLSTHGVIAFTA